MNFDYKQICAVAFDFQVIKSNLQSVKIIHVVYGFFFTFSAMNFETITYAE
jgi:hypothetical protein